jgi:hypothetical protein
MTFPIRNRTRFKPGNPRFDALVTEAEREAEAFLIYNPSRRAAVRIDVSHRGAGEYMAKSVYVSDQGTSLIATVFSRAA